MSPMTNHSVPRRILVVHKTDNPTATALARRLAHWLEERRLVVTVLAGPPTPDHVDTHPDLVLVLGGDGTMIAVARAFVRRPVPLVGLNFGKVGFLTELFVDDWEADLARLLNHLSEGRCRILRRLALAWKVWRHGNALCEGVAVNDVVISRGALARVVHLGVSAQGQQIGNVRADGLILSTPTGCSGYAVSAGGPLVHPNVDAIVITPICPFLSHFPPMVLPATHDIRATVLSEATETFLTADGQESVPLAHNDEIEVTCLPEGVLYARLGEGTYFNRLKARGFIAGYL